jgi:hypothetical protein
LFDRALLDTALLDTALADIALVVTAFAKVAFVVAAAFIETAFADTAALVLTAFDPAAFGLKAFLYAAAFRLAGDANGVFGASKAGLPAIKAFFATLRLLISDFFWIVIYVLRWAEARVMHSYIARGVPNPHTLCAGAFCPRIGHQRGSSGRESRQTEGLKN